MTASYRSEGYGTISPYLVVTDARKTLDFLKEAFDAEELRHISDESGRVVHAEMRIGDSVVMIADAHPPAWPAVPAHVHLYLPDVEAPYRRALDAGAESVQEPVRKEDEDRRGGIRDSGGTTWWIATREE